MKGLLLLNDMLRNIPNLYDTSYNPAIALYTTLALLYYSSNNVDEINKQAICYEGCKYNWIAELDAVWFDFDETKQWYAKFHRITNVREWDCKLCNLAGDVGFAIYFEDISEASTELPIPINFIVMSDTERILRRLPITPPNIIVTTNVQRVLRVTSVLLQYNRRLEQYIPLGRKSVYIAFIPENVAVHPAVFSISSMRRIAQCYRKEYINRDVARETRIEAISYDVGIYVIKFNEVIEDYSTMKRNYTVSTYIAIFSDSPLYRYFAKVRQLQELIRAYRF